MLRFLRGERGFTLTEITVSGALLTLVLVAALGLSVRASAVVARQGEDFDAATQLRQAAMWVTRDLRQASWIDFASMGAGEFSLTVSGTRVSYVLTGSRLIRREEGGNERLVATQLEGISFSTKSGPGGVWVSVEMAGRGKSVKTVVWVVQR